MLKKSFLFCFLFLTLASSAAAQEAPETEATPESEPVTQAEGPLELESEAVLVAPPRVRGGSEHHLVITVTGAEPASGSVEISLFKDNEFFLVQPYLQSSGAVREDGTFRALFNKLEPGEYAVVVVHDANDNQKLDAGFLGFGGESYAYSTQYTSWFGRPDFEDIAITVEGSTLIEISLQ